MNSAYAPGFLVQLVMESFKNCISLAKGGQEIKDVISYIFFQVKKAIYIILTTKSTRFPTSYNKGQECDCLVDIFGLGSSTLLL